MINGPIEIGRLNLTSGTIILNRAIFGANRHNNTLTNTIKTEMTEINLCTLDEMLQRGSADCKKANQTRPNNCRNNEVHQQEIAFVDFPRYWNLVNLPLPFPI